MHNVALSVEKDPTYRQVIEASRSVNRSTVADAIVAAAREIAEAADIKAICCFSQSGTTVSLVARERPRVPIIALTPLMETARRMCLTWGAHCVITEEQDRFKGAVISAVRAARDHGFAGYLTKPHLYWRLRRAPSTCGQRQPFQVDSLGGFAQDQSLGRRCRCSWLQNQPAFRRSSQKIAGCAVSFV